MSSSSSTAAAAASKEGHGVLVPASKIHTSFKTELLNTLASPEFTSGQVKDGKPGREPKLVGILATKKEDARAYAEVRTESNRREMRISQGVDAKWTRGARFFFC
jgi:methylenetetrahydrofolate dehydrogenase (NAD+)